MADYYIDSVNGDDAAAGTSRETAWRTFNNIPLTADSFVGGENVSLARGSHWIIDGSTNLPLWIVGGSSGSLTNHVRITPYGTGAMPIIDGDDNPDIYLVYCENVAFWCEGIDIRNVTAVGVLAPGILFAATGANVGKEYSYIIRNVDVHDITGDGIKVGVDCTATTNGNRREVAWNNVYNIRNDGVALYGNLSGVQAHHNVVHDIGTGDVTPIDTFLWTSGDGITAHAGADGLHIYANRIYRCVDGINLVNNGSARRNIIERNWVYECDEHCVWLTTTTSTVDKWDVWNNVFGMKSGMNATGGATKATGAGITVGWVPGDFDTEFGVDNPATVGIDESLFQAVHDVRIWHNTFYNATSNIPCIILHAYGASAGNAVWSVLGNVMDTTSTGRYHNWIRSGTTPTITCDRNVYDTERANGWIYDGSASATLAAWQAATGKDANAVVGNPALVGNPTTAVDNARLQAGSNALDLASNNAATMPTDFTGRLRPASGSWDAGAFEKFTTAVACVGGGSSAILDGIEL